MAQRQPLGHRMVFRALGISLKRNRIKTSPFLCVGHAIAFPQVDNISIPKASKCIPPEQAFGAGADVGHAGGWGAWYNSDLWTRSCFRWSGISVKKSKLKLPPSTAPSTGATVWRKSRHVRCFVLQRNITRHAHRKFKSCVAGTAPCMFMNIYEGCASHPLKHGLIAPFSLALLARLNYGLPLLRDWCAVN